jgi:hypothetical protein
VTPRIDADRQRQRLDGKDKLSGCRIAADRNLTAASPAGVERRAVDPWRDRRIGSLCDVINQQREDIAANLGGIDEPPALACDHDKPPIVACDTNLPERSAHLDFVLHG